MFRGRPLPAAGEPLWTVADREEAIALQLEDRERCAGCGQPLDETTRPEDLGRYSVEEAECAGCVARETAAGGTSYKGRLLAVYRKPD